MKTSDNGRTDGDILANVYEAIQTIRAEARPLPNGYRLTPAEFQRLLRDAPPEASYLQTPVSTLFSIPVEVVDPIIIAAAGRWVE